MKFGIFFELSVPRPLSRDLEQAAIQNALEQARLADELGFDTAWVVEHHFLEEYSHSSAPEVFLAACSQRTRDIRLGHGIIQTAPGYNHPARTAERVAMLDLVSGGRVEFGSGEASSEAEMGGFGIDMWTKREQWLEGLEVAIRCMTETPFGGHDGQWVSMPPRNVVPKPVQTPHPPLWVACSRRDTILLAAEKGIGALSFAFIDPEDAQKWMSDYETTLAERCVPVGKAVNPQVACVTTMMMHDDETEALRRGIEGANFFGYSLAHYYVFGAHRPAETNVWDEFVERRNHMGYSPEAALAQQTETLGAKIAAGDNTGLRGAVGTPDQVREFLRRYEEAGVDQIIFVLQAGNNRHEHIMESLEMFGTQILPEFAERDEAHVAAREARYAPLIEAAFDRKRALGLDEVPTMPDDYVMKAIPKTMMDNAENEMGQRLLEKIADEGSVGESTTMASLLETPGAP